MFQINLKRLRENAGYSQQAFANQLGIAQSTVGGWEAGKREPNFETMKRIASFFHVSVDFLLGNETASAPAGRGVKIPVLGYVAAGVPIEAVEDILDYEEITPELAGTGEFFSLQIQGHSMEPKISNGDVVIVRKQEDVDSGDTAVVLVNGDNATVKRIKKQDEGISLIPTNPAFEIQFFTNKEIADLPVTILGRVVELRAKF